MWNSVFIRVGQIGRSKGTDTGPTLSGGIGRSGVQRSYGPPAIEDDATISSKEITRKRTVLKDLMSIPQPKTMTDTKNRRIRKPLESYHHALFRVKKYSVTRRQPKLAEGFCEPFLDQWLWKQEFENSGFGGHNTLLLSISGPLSGRRRKRLLKKRYCVPQNQRDSTLFRSIIFGHLLLYSDKFG